MGETVLAMGNAGAALHLWYLQAVGYALTLALEYEDGLGLACALALQYEDGLGPVCALALECVSASGSEGLDLYHGWVKERERPGVL